MNIEKSKNKYKILFLTLLDFYSLEERNIYTDLMSEFVDHGHQVYIISPVEKKNWKVKNTKVSNNCTIIKPKIGNIQKTNIIEKGISTILLESQFLKVIKRDFANIKFDLIIYSTPPVTFANCVKYVKKRDGSISYLLLKDIFPQNTIDLGILKKTGLKGLIYKFFKNKETKLYRNSDYIGCMSEANKNYILDKNNYINHENIEVNPNSEREYKIEIQTIDRESILNQYSIPKVKKLLIYGGNLGKPQGVDFITKCIVDNEQNNNVFIMIIGSGTEYQKIEKCIVDFNLKNTKLFPRMSKNEFEQLVACSDIGLVFLDSRFTIPNFPSRILTYMKQKKPILVASDNATDVGIIAKENGFGDYCISVNPKDFRHLVDKFVYDYDLFSMGKKAYDYYRKNYRSVNSYEIIMKRMKEVKK